jgi:hypothetical protein
VSGPDRDGREKALYRGPAHAAPYPTSRLSPPIELVDLARVVAGADALLNVQASARLRVIADQIRALQAEARKVLEETRRNQELHRATCHFRRTPGRIYHLYERPGGELELSMLSPADWGGRPPHRCAGSYRLEPDMTWTPAEALDRPDDTPEIVARLLDEP